MTDQANIALKIALAYHKAWKNSDLTSAMEVVASNVVSETPFGVIEGRNALHKSESGFSRILKGATMVAAFGDENTALLMYYTHTHPVPSVLSTKYFVVNDGKIVAIKALFDKSQFGN